MKHMHTISSHIFPSSAIISCFYSLYVLSHWQNSHGSTKLRIWVIQNPKSILSTHTSSTYLPSHFTCLLVQMSRNHSIVQSPMSAIFLSRFPRSWQCSVELLLVSISKVPHTQMGQGYPQGSVVLMLQASSVASSKIYLKPVSMLTLNGTARNSMQLSKLKQYTRSRGFAYTKEEI
jgi:hypothetical protein